MAVTTLLLGAVVGAASLHGVASEDVTGSALLAGEPAPAMFLGIVLRNLALAALLFSGVVTAGVTTLLAGLLFGAYVGATTAAAAEQVGTASVLTSVAVYAPLELAAFAVAAWAGLGPVAAVLADTFSGRAQGGLVRRWSRELHPALRRFAASAVLVLVAAAVETVVIQLRH